MLTRWVLQPFLYKYLYLLVSDLFKSSSLFSFPFLISILLKQVGDLGHASELGNYAEYSGAPNEEEVLHYARVVIDVRNYELSTL